MAQWLGIEATKFAWRADVETSSQRLVLLAIAKYADENGNAFPSVTSLCAETRLNEKTAYKVIAELKALGLLVVTKRAVKNTNRYQLSMDTPKNGSTENGTTKNGSTKNGSDIPPKMADQVPPKTEEEHNKEEKKQKNTYTRTQALETYGIPDALISDWRSSLKRPLTQTALDGLKREADIAGISAAEAIRVQLERGWGYFDGAKYKASLAPVPATPTSEPAPAPAASKKESSGDPDELTRQYLAQHRVGNVSSIAPWREQTEDDRRAAAAQAEEREANTFFRTLGSASTASAKEATC